MLNRENLMKRSEINNIIEEAKSFLHEMNWRLPVWAYWSPEDWRGKRDICMEIIENMLGWDITDFGSGNFSSRGLFLFTIRNGNYSIPGGKPYAEKIMMVKENQETPYHFHWSKMEDIINRGGGNLIIQLFNADAEEGFADSEIELSIDGVSRRIPPGGEIVLGPGESVCLYSGLYHRFYGEPGNGTVLVGEVSMTNDDNSDNRFHEQLGRFPEIEEDTPPVHLLVSDYKRYV